MTGPKRPMMGPKHLTTHRASTARAAGTRRVAVHMQHLIDSSLVANSTASAAPEAEQESHSEALVLPLLAMSRVPFPTIRHTFKCTPHQAQVVAAALSSPSPQVMLCTFGLVGLHGSRAVVESFKESNATATILCTHRCVITEVNTPKSRLLGSPSVLPGRRYESTLLRVDSALPSTPSKRPASQQNSEPAPPGLRKGEVKVAMPADVLGTEEELTASLVVRVRDLLTELRTKCESLETDEAAQFLSTLRATNPGWSIPSSPVRLSWFAAQVLPFSATAKEALLIEDSVPARLEAAATLMELLLQTDMMPEQAAEVPDALSEQVEREDTRSPQPRRPHTSKSRLLGSPSDPPEGKSDLRIDKGRGFLEDPIVWQSNAKVPAMSVSDAAKMFLKKAGDHESEYDDDCD